MNGKVVDYAVVVEGAKESGHPVSFLSPQFESACLIMDEMHKKYPNHDVVMYVTTLSEMKRFKKAPRALACPRGHTGQRDGRPSVIPVPLGAYCTVCGWMGEF